MHPLSDSPIILIPSFILSLSFNNRGDVMEFEGVEFVFENMSSIKLEREDIIDFSLNNIVEITELNNEEEL